MESWRECWREVVASSMPMEGLLALERALQIGDERLKPGEWVRSSDGSATTLDELAASGCAIGFCFLKTGITIRQVVERINKINLSNRFREFYHWFDMDCSIRGMQKAAAALLPEVKLELAKRAEGEEVYGGEEVRIGSQTSGSTDVSNEAGSQVSVGIT